MRPHVAAVYAFARSPTISPTRAPRRPPNGDGGSVCGSDRLHRAADGEVQSTRRPAMRDDLIFLALGAHDPDAATCRVALFDDLLSAFGQDTMTTRYASWAELLDYCRRSANPVGRLVLRIAGYRDEALDRSSDALCTALQLTNFWQDFGRDWRAGRLYVPREVHESCGAREADLVAGTADAGVVPDARSVRRVHARPVRRRAGRCATG